MVWSSWYLVHHMLMRWRQINIVVNELSKRNWFGKPSEARDKSRTYFVIDCWDFSLLGFIIVWFCFWFIIGVDIFDCWDLLWLDAVALGFIVVANYSWYTCLLHAYKLACPNLCRHLLLQQLLRMYFCWDLFMLTFHIAVKEQWLISWEFPFLERSHRGKVKTCQDLI